MAWDDFKSSDTDAPVRAPKESANVHLRELAGRIKKLSYRDAVKFATEVSLSYIAGEDMITSLLEAADRLEKA